MREYIKIRTPENMVIEYELAGIGSRAFAQLIDRLLQFIILIILGIIWFIISLFAGDDVYRGWVGSGFTIFLVVVYLAYFFFFEMIMKGRTPGKKISGIRVIKENGSGMTFLPCFIRNIFRSIDTYLGIFFMFFSKRYKRIGDFTAGTIVVKERKKVGTVTLQNIVMQNNISDDKIGINIMETKENEQEINIKITGEEYRVLKNFLSRRHTLDGKVRLELGEELVIKFAERDGELRKRYPYNEEFLEAVAKTNNII